MLYRLSTKDRPRRWRGIVIGGVAAFGVLLGSTHLPATTVQADNGVDQIVNGDGTCTTTVAGWVSYPHDSCHKRMPEPVRSAIGNAATAAGVGALFSPVAGVAAAAGAIGALGGKIPW